MTSRKRKTQTYAFSENRLATELSLRHIRRLEPGEELVSTGYETKHALCGFEVHWDVSEASDRIIEWSRRMREEARTVPGRVCVECGYLYDERED
jgi:hypothetical protein